MVKLNYIYFGFFFLFLCLIHGFHALIVDTVTLSDRLLFTIPVLAQSFLEALFLALVIDFIRQKLSPKFAAFAVAMTVFLILVHTVDLFMIRIMGITIWFVFSFLLDETLHSFMEMLYASNIPVHTWLLIAVVGVGVPVLGHYLFTASQKLSEKKPYEVSYRNIAIVSTSVGITMCFFGLWIFPLHDNVSQEVLERTLPWKTSFSTAQRQLITLPSGLKKPGIETCNFMMDQPLSVAKKPNIYLFIVETFRKDYVADKTIAPNLAAFQEANLAFDKSFSSANATQLSWFSIFHSRFPFYWKNIDWSEGSPPLQVLKKIGYQIHVYTSARLGYYEMDEVIFGKDKNLIDGFHFFEHDHKTAAFKSDGLVVEKLCEDIAKEENQEGRVHIIFLDSTHFAYSWPEGESPFTPFTRNINYFTLSCLKRNLEEVKNGYKNAVHYLDSLFGKFYTTLQEQKQFQESIVILTGDHGEEFFEPRHIFHASDLSTAQTSVPILFKFGEAKQAKFQDRIVSHIDIFPSILDYVTYKDFGWDGSSIFQAPKWPFAVAGKYNASRAPQEFFIHNGQYKLIARFIDPEHMFSCRQLEIVSIRDQFDTALDGPIEVQSMFGPALNAIFSSEK